MKRNRTLFLVALLILLVVAGVFVWQRFSATPTPTTRTQTAVVSRGSLAATVNAAGNVSAPTVAALAFPSSGRVAQVLVRVGDQVKQGQLLMELDTTDLQSALKTAQIDLASQQASFDSTQASLQFALRTAQANLATAKANYDSAQATYAVSPQQLIVAKATLDKARVALEQAQGDYNGVAWRPDVGMMTQAFTLQTATSEYNSALATYKITAAGINDTSIRTAQASVDSAQVAVEQAQKNLDTSTRTAQASLDKAKIAVEQAASDLKNASLVTPFDGYISAVNFGAGDTASGTAVSIVDLNTLQVKVSIAEVDMAKIKVGETAQMTLDALSGKTYTATLAAIGPVGAVTSGVVNYAITFDIANPDGAIRPGMTANLAVQVDKRDNVLLVPTRAVKTQGNQKTVMVMSKDQPMQTSITTGLSSDTMIEVTNGLKEGDVVVVTLTQSTQSNRGMGMPIGPMGGP